MLDEERVETTEISEEQKGSEAPSQGSKPKRSKAEIAAFNLKKHADEARELGLDPGEILGTKTHIETRVEDEDSKPVTVGMLRDIQKTDAQKTALQMANDIEDETTRATVKQYLTDNIKPSGNAESDFKLALAAASAGKNKEILGLIEKHVPPKRTASGGSSPAKVEEEFVPTTEEQQFMRPPYNLSKEKILAARKKTEAKG